MRFWSPFRWTWRHIAGRRIPKILARKSINHNIKASSYLKENNLNKELIISLTSFPRRIANVWQVIECLTRQSIQPDKIILYLSKDQFPRMSDIPESLISRQNDIFQIRLVDGDIRSYKKFYYSFQEFPDDLVLLVDDDIYYPSDMIESMLNAYLINKDSIICRFGYIISRNNDGSMKSYIKWPLSIGASDSQDILFGTGGGSLYEPKKMYRDTCNKDLFLSLCPLADDIWMNAMARLANLQVIKLDEGGLLPIMTKDEVVLYKENVLKGQNDIQLRAVEDYYKKHINRSIFSR